MWMDGSDGSDGSERVEWNEWIETREREREREGTGSGRGWRGRDRDGKVKVGVVRVQWMQWMQWVRVNCRTAAGQWWVQWAGRAVGKTAGSDAGRAVWRTERGRKILYFLFLTIIFLVFSFRCREGNVKCRPVCSRPAEYPRDWQTKQNKTGRNPGILESITKKQHCRAGSTGIGWISPMANQRLVFALEASAPRFVRSRATEGCLD